MKKPFYLTIVLFIGLLSCSKSSISDPSSSDGLSSDFIYEGTSYFKFTSRGKDYYASSKAHVKDPNSLASLYYDSKYGNKLTITAFDDAAPADWQLRTSLLITIPLQGDMKKGIYTFISDQEMADCEEKGFVGCSMVSNGLVVPYSDYYVHNLEYSLKNSVHSNSGTLEITDFRISKFNLGTAEGTISGNFHFNGLATDKDSANSGSVSGRFENVWVVATKK